MAQTQRHGHHPPEVGGRFRQAHPHVGGWRKTVSYRTHPAVSVQRGDKAAGTGECLRHTSIIQRMTSIGVQSNPAAPTDSDYLNGSLVSPGYLPFFVNWRAWLEHSTHLVQETKGFRGCHQVPGEEAALGLCPRYRPALH